MSAYPPFHPLSKATPPGVYSSADFSREFPQENELIEFKTGTSGRTLQETVVSFSNTRGGVVLIGVDDAGVVLGRALDPGTADAIHELMSHVVNSGRYGITSLVVEDKPVVVLSIAARREGFAQTSQGVVNVRKGTRDQALLGDELLRFVNSRSRSRYETTPTEISLDEADEKQIATVSNAFRWSSSTTRQRLADIGLASDGKLTVAGVLHLFAHPEKALGKTYVEILRFADDSSVDYDRRDEVEGPLSDQLRISVARVMDELGKQLVVIGVKRYELAPIPEIVVREALANALSHRSYELNRTPVRIEIRPSFVEISSPGGLPEPVTIQNMRETQSSRNIAVIRVMRQLGLAEDAGRGIDTIQDAMSEEMLDPPEFSEDSHHVSVVLPIRSMAAPAERAWIRELESRGTLHGSDRLILVHAARGELLTNSRVREILQVDPYKARDALQRLRDSGFLTQHGSRGSATYSLGGSLEPPPGLRLGRGELEDLVIDAAELRPIANRDVRELTGLDRSGALSLLNRLVRENRLTRLGERKGSKYVKRR